MINAERAEPGIVTAIEPSVLHEAASMRENYASFTGYRGTMFWHVYPEGDSDLTKRHSCSGEIDELFDGVYDDIFSLEHPYDVHSLKVMGRWERIGDLVEAFKRRDIVTRWHTDANEYSTASHMSTEFALPTADVGLLTAVITINYPGPFIWPQYKIFRPEVGEVYQKSRYHLHRIGNLSEFDPDEYRFFSTMRVRSR